MPFHPFHWNENAKLPEICVLKAEQGAKMDDWELSSLLSHTGRSVPSPTDEATSWSDRSVGEYESSSSSASAAGAARGVSVAAEISKIGNRGDLCGKAGKAPVPRTAAMIETAAIRARPTGYCTTRPSLLLANQCARIRLGLKILLPTRPHNAETKPVGL